MFPNVRVTIDGRTFTGGLVIAGFMLLLNRMIGMPAKMPNAEFVKDGMLVLGTAIGVIVGAIWRSSGAEERNRELLVHAAATGTPQGAPPAPELKEAVASGTEEGVKGAVQGLAGSAVSIGVRDRPATVDIVAAPASYVGPEMPDVSAAAIDTPEDTPWNS